MSDVVTGRTACRSWAVVVLGAAGAVAASALAASAGFTAAVAGSQPFGTATLTAPSDATTAHGSCLAGEYDEIVVSWTATTATWADGYEVLRSAAATGPFAAVATVTGRSTTSYVDSSLAFEATYHYVVRARKLSWTSADTTAVSLVTRTATCT